MVRRTVRRLQARIVKAVREGKWHKVKALVYLLTHSYSGRALAILRVVNNQGAKTPGVDGVCWSHDKERGAAFARRRRRGYRPQSLRRVYIAKGNGQKRPLGIPTMTDRAMHALYLLGLDPIAETQADGHSYGFRLERCGADAIEQCHRLLGNRHGPRWILEGDSKSGFDRISHSWLLDHVPMNKDILRAWLQAGFLEEGVRFDTTEGTPQGGIISPVLANRALDGLPALLAEHFPQGGQRSGKVHLVRYADDLIITGTSKEFLQHQVMPLVAHFLKKRGLERSHEKTRITHLDDGFDFLGQTIRRYPCGKVRVKPSRKNVRTFLSKIKETIQEAGSWTAGELIQRLNQQVKGWTMVHRHAASKRTFSRVDRRIFHMLRRWCRHRHRNKSWTWINRKYFRSSGHRHWIFNGTLPDSNGKEVPIELMEANRVSIRRYVKIRQDANPYDPSWELYLEARLYWQLEGTLAGRGRIEYLGKVPEGRCVRCGQSLRPSEKPWPLHHRHWRRHGGPDTVDNLELLHGHCHRQIHDRAVDGTRRVSREASRNARAE